MKITEIINEAMNPAQQAAIAINMKKHHKKPKNDGVAEGDMSRRDFLTKSSVVGGLALGIAADLLTRGPSINIDGIEYQPASISRSERGAEVRTVKLKNGDIVKIWSLDRKGGNSGEKVIHLYRKVEQEGVAEGENWSKYNHKRAGGMSSKSVKSYRRSHPGSKIQTAVTKKPSKIKKGSKDAKRRASFCARMKGMKKHRTSAKTAHDPNSNINKSLRRWHCESIEQMEQLVMLAEQKIRNLKK